MRPRVLTRLLERAVVATLRTAAWVVVATIAAVLVLIVALAVVAATTYAKSLGVPPLAVDLPIAIAGCILTIGAIREVRRLRELYDALREDPREDR